MIDIHCHLLSGLDDGATSVAMSLDMARMAVADGITTIVCTPHVMPGRYDNNLAQIDANVATLRALLAQEGIPLTLQTGADVHIAPRLEHRLGVDVPTIAGTQYFLFEPPHHVVPPRMDEVVLGLLAAGFVPILTHPERLTWIDGHYDLIHRLGTAGIPIQITAGSVTGSFGRRARYWAERLLDDGFVDILATDAHNLDSRAPRLSHARDVIAARMGEVEADAMTSLRPAAILAGESLPPRAAPITPAPQSRAMHERLGKWFRQLRGRGE